MMKYAKYIAAISAAILAVALPGCMRDDSAVCPRTDDAAGTTFSIALPPLPKSPTRAGREGVDSEIERILHGLDELDLLLVNTSSGNRIDACIAIDESKITRQGGYATFRVNFTPDPQIPTVPTDRYKFIMISNGRRFVERSLEDSGGVGACTEAEFMSDFCLFRDGTSSNDWYGIAFGSMWGVSENTYTLPASGNIPTIQMISMLALWEFIQDPSLDDVLEIDHVFAANAYMNSRIAPWDPDTETYNYSHTLRKVTAPSIYDDTTCGMDSYFSGSNASYNGDEAILAVTPEHDNATCEDEMAFIVYASYGPLGNRNDYYYKLRLLDKDGNRLDILRNHYYTLTIKNVSGPGYSSPAEAYDGNSYIQADIVDWTNAPQNVIFDGSYYLNISHPRLDLYAEAGYLEMVFETNHPDEIDVQATTPNGWFACDGNFTQIDTDSVFKTTTITQRWTWSANTYGAERTAIIRVLAGNMEYYIHVSQSTRSWLMVHPVMAFPLDGLFHKIPVVSELGWSANISGSGDSIDKILLSTFSSKESTEAVFFKTANETSNNDYPVTLSFINTSEYHYTPVHATVILQGIRTVPEQRSGSNCYMINHNNPRTILIPVSQVLYTMGTVPGIATNGFLGSDWIQNHSLLQAQVLWSDVNNFTSAGVVANVEYIAGPSLAESYIHVTPGTAQGNAGIILYEDMNGIAGYQHNTTDKIRWSWHIWKSEYYPYNNGVPSASGNGGIWMDRNLGAMSNTPGDIKTAGFTYQWGRKDPFPGAGAWSANASAIFYYVPDSGVSFLENSHTNDINLPHAVNNPLTRYFYTTGGNGNKYDWFTYTGIQNNDLWGGGAATNFLHPAAASGNRKSVYDPCPEGYRVPKNGAWNDADWGDRINNGRINNRFGGYYPVAGARHGGQAGLYTVASVGYYWSATPVNNSGYYLTFGVGTVSPSEYITRAYGFSVRCVAE